MFVVTRWWKTRFPKSRDSGRTFVILISRFQVTYIANAIVAIFFIGRLTWYVVRISIFLIYLHITDNRWSVRSFVHTSCFLFISDIMHADHRLCFVITQICANYSCLLGCVLMSCELSQRLAPCGFRSACSFFRKLAWFLHLMENLQIIEK